MSASSASHWYVKVALFRPSESDKSVVSAVSVSPTRIVPVMVGSPVAVVLDTITSASGIIKGGADSLASLVSDSALPASSVKVTRTLMALPSSASVTVYVELVAPSMSASVLVAGSWRTHR